MLNVSLAGAQRINQFIKNDLFLVLVQSTEKWNKIVILTICADGDMVSERITSLKAREFGCYILSCTSHHLYEPNGSSFSSMKVLLATSALCFLLFQFIFFIPTSWRWSEQQLQDTGLNLCVEQSVEFSRRRYCCCCFGLVFPSSTTQIACGVFQDFFPPFRARWKNDESARGYNRLHLQFFLCPV